MSNRHEKRIARERASARYTQAQLGISPRALRLTSPYKHILKLATAQWRQRLYIQK